MNIARWHYFPKWATLLLIMVLLLSNACRLFAPPPPPTPPPKAQNQPPVIQSVTAEKVGNPSNAYQVVCDATDADGDTLKYWWSADGGMIKGEGDNVTWIAPDTGSNYTVKVVVTDGKGGEATGSATITVSHETNMSPIINKPPVITKMLITYITLFSEDERPVEDIERIRGMTPVEIRCIANDPDGDKLSYNWSAAEGRLKWIGNKAEWISPSGNGNYTVTVTVSNGKGGTTRASVNFQVVCCGH